jgi:hypothetical protein
MSDTEGSDCMDTNPPQQHNRINLNVKPKPPPKPKRVMSELQKKNIILAQQKRKEKLEERKKNIELEKEKSNNNIDMPEKNIDDKPVNNNVVEKSDVVNSPVELQKPIEKTVIKNLKNEKSDDEIKLMKKKMKKIEMEETIQARIKDSMNDYKEYMNQQKEIKRLKKLESALEEERKKNPYANIKFRTPDGLIF